jgi:DNA-binding NarL/FixJ family response regulator
MSIRVLVADDQALVRAGFRMILEAQPEFEVVGEAANGREAVDGARRERPDVLLMDIRMPEMNGLEATREVLALELPHPARVIILTTFDLDEYVYEALAAGASGFLLKDVLREELLHAVRVVAAGDALIAPSITRRLIADFVARHPTTPRTSPGLELLTPRERETLELMARGLTNAEIAERFVVGEATVKTHVGHVLMKLGLRDRVQAVILAYNLGLVAPGDT